MNPELSQKHFSQVMSLQTGLFFYRKYTLVQTMKSGEDASLTEGSSSPTEKQNHAVML